MKPLVSVLMPVYNSEDYLEEAIKSILNQSYSNFEFLIIDDASSDRSLDIIYSFKDDRIKLIKKNLNTGYTVSLNMGLAMCQGKYIARMDSDDISLPLRLEKQVALMEAFPEIGICGTWVETIGKITGQIKKYPSTHEKIKTQLFVSSHFVHPTVMMRKSALDQYTLIYDPQFEPAEDYALWVQLGSFVRLANIAEVLLKYRVHEKQVSREFSEKQLIKCNSIRMLQIRRLGIEPTAEEWQLHIDLILNKKKIINKLQLHSIIQWLTKLKECNEKIMYFEKKTFYYLLMEYAFVSYSKLPFNLSLLIQSAKSPFPILTLSSPKQAVIFLVKSILK